MILEIIPVEGVGRGRPLVIVANQIVIRNDQGTPIAAAAIYGPDESTAVGSVAHDEAGFHRMLRVLGINTTTVVDTILMPKPEPGARLLLGPK